MNVLVAGGTGFIGKALLESLKEKADSIILLTRNAKRQETLFHPKIKTVEWNGRDSGPWTSEIEQADAVVNLSGESIEGRWTPSKKARIKSSRIESTRILVSAISKSKKKPKVLLNASAVGYYGNVPEGDVSETSPPGKDFLAQVCLEWEQTALEAAKSGVRVVLLRTSLVLGREGGALPKILLPFRFFLGGPLGSGQQWFPWIHLRDEVDAILFSLENPRISGPVNLVAPDSVRMAEFCRVLGQTLGRPSWLKITGIALKIAFGEMGEMLLQGQKAVPTKLTEAGYLFSYPQLDQALTSIHIPIWWMARS